MSKFATSFFAIVAVLNGIVIVSSASRTLSLRRDIGPNDLLYNSPNSVENITTVYYGSCDRLADDDPDWFRKCSIRRVQASFSADANPREDECNVTLRCDSEAGWIDTDNVRIDSLGRDRAVVRWHEEVGNLEDDTRRYRPRFSVVDFSDCRVKTTKLPESQRRVYSLINEYAKGDGDFEVAALDGPRFSRLTIDAEGVITSRIDTLVTYQSEGYRPDIYRLADRKGYLLIESYSWPHETSIAVFHIQPNGQKRYLTRTEGAQDPSVSLANGLIGICARDRVALTCAQFELFDEKEIGWFSAGRSVAETFRGEEVVHNLPRGQGFLTHSRDNEGLEKALLDIVGKKYLWKIGLDGEAKQFLEPDMRCGYVSKGVQETGQLQIFEDERGDYCLSTVCVKRLVDSATEQDNLEELYKAYDNEMKNFYVKLHSNVRVPKRIYTMSCDDGSDASEFLFDRVEDLHRYMLMVWQDIRGNVDWANEKERHELLWKLHPLFCVDWEGAYPNLRDFCRAESIEQLLTDAVNLRYLEHYPAHEFIRFVARSGYRNDPAEFASMRRTTALHLASKRCLFPGSLGDAKVRELFAIYDDREANYVDAEDGSTTHLHVACKFGYERIVGKFLERKKQSIDCLDSALRVALDWEREEVVELLLRHGADPNRANVSGETPLHVICKNHSDDLAEIFCDASEKVGQRLRIDAQDERGWTPLHFALIRRNSRLVELLLRRGADPNLADEDGTSPLHLISEMDDPDSAKILFEICGELVKVDARDKFGCAPLHAAAFHSDAELMQLLLRNGADPNPANADGTTPLHLVNCIDDDADAAHFWRSFFEISEEEMRRKVQVDARNARGWTPLHLALYSGSEAATRLLLSRGADPNLATARGETPLHVACRRSEFHRGAAMARSFLRISEEVDRPVELDARDRKGRTPLQWAVANLEPSIVDLLLERGADLFSFVFPDESFLGKEFKRDQREFRLILATGALACVESLENAGYRAERGDASKIAKLFAEHGLFERTSASFERRWYNDDEFDDAAKEIMVKPYLSLHDLVWLRRDEAAKLLAPRDYYELARSKELLSLPDKFGESCVLHLCEKMSRGFFQRWGLQPYCELKFEPSIFGWEITRVELPIDEGLWRVCEAVTDFLGSYGLSIAFACVLYYIVHVSDMAFDCTFYNDVFHNDRIFSDEKEHEI
ncbi:unnamed protein product [Trichogramma brassicae]|uniref:Uncharacterized protein n=1 Tax=Trichogramma brassicae TaxID=86971 RepID=A0A6H5I0V7_9HYME|nr:unnamed protein product [Trichogramma brassicae]